VNWIKLHSNGLFERGNEPLGSIKVGNVFDLYGGLTESSIAASKVVINSFVQTWCAKFQVPHSSISADIIIKYIQRINQLIDQYIGKLTIPEYKSNNNSC
jgi:hypothetical protein